MIPAILELRTDWAGSVHSSKSNPIVLVKGILNKLQRINQSKRIYLLTKKPWHT